MKVAETIGHDILVVGGGLAGMTAAIEAKRAGADVALISKVHPIRSHSGAAQGGINAAIKTDDNWRDHMYDTVKGGRFLNDQDATRILCQEAASGIEWLHSLGVVFSRNPDGTLAQRPFGGQRRNRTCFAADHTGHNILHVLYETILRCGVPVYEETYVTALLTDSRRFGGLMSIDLLRGRLVLFRSKACILATGGAGRVFGQSSNALINTGDGVALAWRARLPIEDMEFFQIHPTGLLNGILMTEGIRGEGGYLVNALGERFMERYSPQFKELAPRDVVSRAIQNEINEGRGFPGQYVHLDLRHLGEARINERLPQIREIAIHFGGVDPVHEPIPIRPTVHYTMGGIATDTDGRTVCAGLYAAGECACVSVHGANRLGGNSLLETIVYGRRSGRAAARESSGAPCAGESAVQAAARDEERRLSELLAREDGESVADLRTAMETLVQRNFGLFKNESDMQKGLQKLLALRERYGRVIVQDKSLLYNLNLVHALELGAMLDVALLLATASLWRKESRGSHYRTDFPHCDNRGFLKHSMLTRAKDSTAVLSTKPVTIEDIQPED